MCGMLSGNAGGFLFEIEKSQVVGRFEATGVRPTFMDKLRVAGVDLPNSLFASA